MIRTAIIDCATGLAAWTSGALAALLFLLSMAIWAVGRWGWLNDLASSLGLPFKDE